MKDGYVLLDLMRSVVKQSDHFFLKILDPIGWSTSAEDCSTRRFNREAKRRDLYMGTSPLEQAGC